MIGFPKCEFRVLLPSGVITSGTTVDGILELTVPEPISRAEHVDLFYRNKAWAGFGSGKHRRVIRRDMLIANLRVDLPVGQPLPAGTIRYPFKMDVPPWVSPTFFGADCAIENVIETRLDVDWAKDPVSHTYPIVVVPPTEGVATPLVTRSPPHFHDSIVVEVTLESSAIVHGQSFGGHVALRGGHDARFDGVLVTLVSVAHVQMGQGAVRRGTASTVRIPADRLRRGESVPFLIPQLAGAPHTFRNGYLDHLMQLDITVDIPWASDPSFSIPVLVLPAGSRLHETGAQESVVGAERVQQLALAMARATGLRPGKYPTMVEGQIGSVFLRLSDSPRGGRIGVDADFMFPDVGLGTVFRPLGMLGGFRQSPLLPEAMRLGHSLRFDPEDPRPRVDDAALAAFARGVLGGLGTTEEIRFSDHHLGTHFPLANDGSDALEHLARFACARAKAISDAVAALPFPAACESGRAAWQATATEQSAFLVASTPSLHGVVFRSRILGGEERIVGAVLRTVWKSDGPGTVVALDLRGAPLPKAAAAEIGDQRQGTRPAPPSEHLRAVSAVFPMIRAENPEHVILERPGFTQDPRSLFGAIEAFVAWLLASRGERRADAPYR